MSDRTKKTETEAVSFRVVKVYCRRLERQLPVEEHERCPYCFGKAERVRTARHELFCDFRPGVDPVSFGFPEDRGRYRN
ncbi:MAG: hypothetical protein ACYTG6_03500 [Planctomycetota bacterium]|jgi:hypothetical protein